MSRAPSMEKKQRYIDAGIEAGSEEVISGSVPLHQDYNHHISHRRRETPAEKKIRYQEAGIIPGGGGIYAGTYGKSWGYERKETPEERKVRYQDAGIVAGGGGGGHRGGGPRYTGGNDARYYGLGYMGNSIGTYAGELEHQYGHGHGYEDEYGGGGGDGGGGGGDGGGGGGGGGGE